MGSGLLGLRGGQAQPVTQISPAEQVFRPVQICSDSLVPDLHVVDRTGVTANHESGSLLEGRARQVAKEP